MKKSRLTPNQYVRRLLNIGIALTAEKDYNKLLEMILSEARNITNADGGTLYICENGKLSYKIMQNSSLGIFKGGEGEVIDIPPVEMSPSNVSAYCAMTREVINIPDVYNSTIFDFSGPKKFDKAMGYRTKSMLVIPLINREDKVIGVLQLINALDGQNNPIPFDKSLEDVVKSLASQAGIAVANMQYIDEIKNFFDSFVRVMASAIDERTPYNANHSRNIANLAEKFANYINKLDSGKYKDVFFSSKDIKQLVMAAWLHDIGKIVVPLEVMDKPTRLADSLNLLMLRLELIESKLKANYLEKIIKNPEKQEEYTRKWQEDTDYIREVKEFIVDVNNPAKFVDEEIIKKLNEIRGKTFENIAEPLLTDDELENLSIPKGTLTESERKIIESHVDVCERLLMNMNFPDYLKDVPDWAVRHHELLDGTGYSKKCKGDELPIQVRILTILDIYDALTATDRPYKKGMPKEKAFQILGFMAKEGKLDGELLKIFEESKVWDE